MRQASELQTNPTNADMIVGLGGGLTVYLMKRESPDVRRLVVNDVSGT